MYGYKDILKEKDQKKRFEEIFVDCDDWQCDEAICIYIAENIEFPFKAKTKGRKKSKEFTVLKFIAVEPHRVVCEIDINGTKSRMPLTEIEDIDEKSANNIVISDYLKYIKEF